jgi:uncharacterized protein YpmS
MKAVVCCLLATSAIMLSEKKKTKRKMWSKKWYLKRNISCDAHRLNDLLETVVEDYIYMYVYIYIYIYIYDAIVVWAGEVRILCDSLSELRSSV